MTIDIARARRETPGVAELLHFNNAGASLMPEPVLEKMLEHLRLESRIGGYEAADREAPALERVYDAAAALLNCGRDEIAFMENATRAWDMAFYSIPLAPGDRVLTAISEYGSNYVAFLQAARRTGACIEPVPNDESGQLSISALRSMMDDRVKLIAITHVPTNGGLVNPAAEVGRVARSAGVPFLLDACQSVGQLPVDVRAIGCDMLSLTGRKFLRGPRGTGLLYVRRELAARLEPPFLDLHAASLTAHDQFEIRPDTRRFENWEINGAGKIGLGAAIDYTLGWGIHAIHDRVMLLASLLRERLGRIPGVTVRDLGTEQCGIVTFTMVGRKPIEVRDRLRAQRINVSVSPREYTLLDMDARGFPALIRASVHYYNTEEEVERFVKVLGSGL
jgi:selenocysteine lyase/cysteine desulfurase